MQSFICQQCVSVHAYRDGTVISIIIYGIKIMLMLQLKFVLTLLVNVNVWPLHSSML